MRPSRRRPSAVRGPRFSTRAGRGRWSSTVSAVTQRRWRRPATAGDDTPELFVSAWALSELIEAATRSNEAALAHEGVERLAAITAVAGNDWALGIEARSRALVSDGEAAQRLYLEAIERLGRTRLRPELGRAHLLYGEWLRRENRRVRIARRAASRARDVHDNRHGGISPSALASSCWQPVRRCAGATPRRATS